MLQLNSGGVTSMFHKTKGIDDLEHEFKEGKCHLVEDRDETVLRVVHLVALEMLLRGCFTSLASFRPG